MSDDPFSPYPAPQSLGSEFFPAPISVSGESPFPPPEPEPPQPKPEVPQPVEDLTRKFVSAQRSAAVPAPAPEFTPTPVSTQTLAPASASAFAASAPVFATAPTPGPESESDLLIMDEDEILEQRALKTVVGIVIAAVAIFIIGGGGVWYFLVHNTDDAEPSPQPAENLIIAEDGGEVSSEYGASVIIPSDALAEDTEIGIKRVALGDITDRFELQPHGLKFLKPVTVLIPYKENGFPANKTAQDIRLKYWSDDPDFRRENLSYTVNSEDKILSTEVTHF